MTVQASTQVPYKVRLMLAQIVDMDMPRIQLIKLHVSGEFGCRTEALNVGHQKIQCETGKTVLPITHSILEAMFLADRITAMTSRPGEIAAVHNVPLPRPRTLDVMSNPLLVEIAQKPLGHFPDAYIG
jgi:NitT/TauT family transport system ATP-binding protein